MLRFWRLSLLLREYRQRMINLEIFCSLNLDDKESVEEYRATKINYINTEEKIVYYVSH